MIRLRRACAGLLVAGAIVGTAVACSSTRPSLTGAEYRRRVRAECVALARATRTLPSPAPTDTERFVDAGRHTLVLERATLERIRSLDPPSVDARAVGRWLAFVDTGLDATAASLTAQAAGDFVKARAANVRGAAALARADAVARSLTLDDCTTLPAG